MTTFYLSIDFETAYDSIGGFPGVGEISDGLEYVMADCFDCCCKGRFDDLTTF